MTAQRAFERRAFGGVALAFLVHGLIVSTWVSRIPSIKTALALRDGTIGLALLGTAIGSITAIPISGWLVTRYGSRRAVRWTAIGFCAALLLPALASNAWTLFAALLLFGAMGGANDVAMNAQAVATERLLPGPAMSRFHALFSFGGILGAGLGGLVAGLKIAPREHLAIAAILFLAAALLAPRFMADPRPEPHPHPRPKLRRLSTALAALSAIGFCILLTEGAIADWTGIYLKQVLFASAAVVPLGYAVFSGAMAIFRFAGDALTVQLGRPAMIRYGALVASAGIAIAVLAPSPGWALAGFAAAGAGLSSIIPLVFAAGGRLAGVSEGAGVATVSGIGYLGFLAGPPTIGFISEASSLRMGLLLLVVLTACAALLVGVLQRTANSPLSAPETQLPAAVPSLEM